MKLTRTIAAGLLLGGSIFLAASATATAASFQTNSIEGWRVLLDERLLAEDKAATEKALGLLRGQLQEIVRVVPAPAVAKLREVTLWFSPEYPGVKPRAEYHPGAGWLRDNGRDPAMVKGVEFTDVRNFEAETKRMPNFTLHELAHAYHDRVLPRGFGNPEIKTAFDRAKASKSYDKVERWFGNGRPNMKEKAYAMSSAMEYFAESTEAFFSRNDFFPFTRAELKQHDPEMEKLLERLWGFTTSSNKTSQVRPPPPGLKVPAFYKKYLDADGYPIVASEKVNDYALKEAAYLVNLMLAKRPDVRAAMIQSGSRLCIIAHDEFTTDLPEWAKMTPKDYWDARARGTGGSADDPLCTCGEENLLAYPGDPYAAENIFIHEFAHNIHLRGMVSVDPTFDPRVKATYNSAMKAGLWKGKYASVNHHEYFAEGVQSWFDNNRVNDHDHNHVNTRALLLEYDPGLAALCREVFGDTVFKYTKPATRLRDHLEGYDPTAAPAFVWPERLRQARADIRAQAVARDQAANDKRPRQPNILHIHADDHRADGLHALGNPLLVTPNLDSLVERGMAFTRAYTMGSMVSAVCTPSRTMMLTGRSWQRIPGAPGATPNAKDPATFLPRVIQAAGYQTWHMGKAGNGFPAGLTEFQTSIRDEGRGDERAGNSRRLADRTIEFLKSRAATNESKPFYIYLAPPVPHDPRSAEPQFHKLYDPAKIPLSPAFLPQHPFDNGEMTVRDEALAPWPRTPDDTKQQLADYYACITGLDHHVGRIFAALQASGEWTNTIVIFSGDNGLSMGDHGLFGKQNLYELGGLHVPLVVAGPGVSKGKSEALVYLMDLFPTFTEFAGAKDPEGVEGQSLVPILTGKATKVRDVLYTGYRNGQRAIRDDRWKLIRYPLVDRTQLFDLKTDPHELNNLADKPEHAAKVAQLTASLEKEMSHYADQHPLNVANPKPAEWSPSARGKEAAKQPE